MLNKPVKVLIVDDDPVVLSVLEETFSNEENLAISTMSDSEEAYQRLARESFDLLITDLMMPRVDGLSLLQHATKCQPDILVVMVSGYASLETTLQAIHAGVYDYITKPFRMEEFRLLVHNVAGHIRLKAENKSLGEEVTTLKERVARLEESLLNAQQEATRLEEELGRWQEMVGQTGVAATTETTGGNSRTSRLSFYEKGVETSDERFDREFHHLESLFSEGRLTPEEFDMARQRLKTLV
jgi:DNA-binding NtrC family response regulator